MFKPRNRHITELLWMPGAMPTLSTHPRVGDLKGEWYANDLDHKDEPSEWASESTNHTVQTSHTKAGHFIVCSDRGMWLRHPKMKSGRKGMVRQFKTHVDAAIAAEEASTLVPADA